MEIDDLDLNELVELDAGVIRFVGQRALLLDAMALGLLRKDLVERLGPEPARTLLTRLGFAQGWRMADALRNEFQWTDEADWRRAGIRLHSLAGLFRTEPGHDDPLTEAGATLRTSCEAEQHLLHFGRSDDTVCWMLCGLLGGYLSHITGRLIHVREGRCLGRGDSTCQLFGRPREASDDLESHLDLIPVIGALKTAERKIARHRGPRRPPRPLAPQVGKSLGIIARSPRMEELLDLTYRVARVDSTVLITGESGTGKERIAQLIHEESTRAKGPYIAVNCGAMTETLLESEFFGHAHGAFTGAAHDRPGLFEAAHTGTLLLDEIGEITHSLQVKLLRVLQEREIRRIGENNPRPVDVRIVAATNRDLARRVESGDFRQDLYYRLKVVELHVPPLRERRADLLPLARALLNEAALRMHRPISSLAPTAAAQLLRHDWPGNVRELENAMERAVALARSTRIEVDDLPEEVRRAAAAPAAPTGVRPMDEVEKEYILSALAQNNGNQTHTAKQLGIGSATLYRKLKSYGVINRGRTDAPM